MQETHKNTHACIQNIPMVDAVGIDKKLQDIHLAYDACRAGWAENVAN